jgi:hypothetical protein
LVKKYVASGFSRTWSISWTIETVRLKADATVRLKADATTYEADATTV